MKRSPGKSEPTVLRKKRTRCSAQRTPRMTTVFQYRNSDRQSSGAHPGRGEVGRTSAPRLPRALQTNRDSMSDIGRRGYGSPRQDTLRRALRYVAIAAVVEFNINHPENSDSNTSSNESLHFCYLPCAGRVGARYRGGSSGEVPGGARWRLRAAPGSGWRGRIAILPQRKGDG
jgi:hypothetical protein